MTPSHSAAGNFAYFRGDGLELVLCRQSSFSYPLHNHVSVFTLGLILDGVLTLDTDSGSGIYRESGAFLIPPYVPHRISAKPRYTLLSLCVSKRIVKDGNPETAKAAISDFLHAALGRPPLERKIMDALHALAAPVRGIPPKPPAALDGLRMRLELEPERRYSIDDMAALAFASKYSLIRSFKKEVGLTPHQFLIQNRVRRGQRLLERSASAPEAALAAGFCDQSHFIRHFKRIVGLTPAEYARSCRVIPPVPAGGHHNSAGINLANR